MGSRKGKNLTRIESALDRLKMPSKEAETYPESSTTRSENRYKKSFAANSSFVITTHFFKSLFAPTILAIPAGFHNGGILFSICGFPMLLCLIGYNIRRLILSAEYLSAREKIAVRTYDEVAYVSLKTCSARTKGYAPAFKIVVNLLFFITYLDACTIFMIFIARNIEALIIQNFPHSFLEVRCFLFFQVILLMSMSSIRHLKYLTPFSFIASILLFSAVIFSVAFFFISDSGPLNERLYVGSVRSMVRFVCIVLFCMSGISIALTLKSSMLYPQHFFSCPGIYYVALVTIATIYIFYGFLGYLKYGEDTQPSIMLNLPQGTAVSVVVKFLAIFSVLLTSPLVFYIAFNVIWNNYLKHVFTTTNVLFTEYFVRYCLILICYLLATAYPDLGGMIVLKGALFHSHLEITIPAILDYVTFYPEVGTGRYHCRLFKTICLAFCGTFFCVSGVVVSILDWVHLGGVRVLSLAGFFMGSSRRRYRPVGAAVTPIMQS